MSVDDKVTAGSRKEPPSPPRNSPTENPPPAKKTRGETISDLISSLTNEHGSISLRFGDKDFGDTSTTTHPTLEKLSITITKKDYPVKSKPSKGKSNTNRETSEQQNVPKLTSSFMSAGFFSSSSFTNKLTDDDINFVADANQPLIPCTEEMTETKEQLEGMKKKAESAFRSVVNNGDTAFIRDLGNIVKQVKDNLQQLNDLVTAMKSNISVVESVRKRSQTLMEACLANSSDMTDSTIKWGMLLNKATKMLELVEKEKERMKQKSTTSPTTSQSETASEDPEVQIIDPTAAAAVTSTTAAAAAIELPKAANGERKVRKTKTAAPTQEERDESEKDSFISYENYLTQLGGGLRSAHPPIRDQGFVWENGMVFCTCCKHTRFKHLKNLFRHTTKPTHKENLARAQASETALYQDGLHFIDRHAMGAHQDTSTLTYRMKAMRAAALHNVPVANIKGIAEDWVDEYANETLGNQSDFVALTAPALHKAIMKRIREIVGGAGCFKEFAITFDGTPSFAEAEAIIVRIVTKDWNVIELLVRCGLYAKKLNSDELKSHVIDTITNQVGLELKNWLSTHQDRAKTNVAALNKIYEDDGVAADAKPAKNDCCSHTISNAGKKTLGDKGIAVHAERFRKMFQALINQPGLARERASEVMGETVKRAGGVRFFQKLEQVMQIHECTPEKVIAEIVQHCIEKKASPESAANMLREFDPSTDAKANLAMAIVELAAISEGLKTFVEACYTLEGDSCVILRALDVFKRIEEQIDAGFDTPSLTEVVARAVGLIDEVEGDWSTKCNIATEAATEAAAVAAAAKAAVDDLMSQKASLTSNTTSRGRTAQRTNRATNIGALDKLLDEIVEAKIALKSAEAAEKNAKDESGELHKLFEEWKEKFPHRTPDALLAHGKSILQPAGEYYNKLFLEEDGDCYNIRKMSEACLMFDPIELSKMSETDIVVTNHKHADLLEFFRYEQFTDDFRERLKKEMPALVKEAKRDHDLDRIPASKEYKTRLQERIRRKKPEGGEDIPWQKDAGEYSERIWQWWKARQHDFPLHALALRLVVLAQLSSCSVERVFSKLKIIRERCGENLYDDMCEVRLFMQCNGDLSELADKMKKYNEE